MSDKNYAAQFLQKSYKIHGKKYDYSRVNYKNNITKVEIICPIHQSFFKRPADHTNTGGGCQLCARERYTSTTAEFIIKANNVHNFCYDYSSVIYENWKTKVKIICNKHGIFMQSPNAHLVGKGCNECRKQTRENFIIRAAKKHNNFYTYENVIFKGSKSIVSITCPIHNDFDQRADAHLSGESCPHCKCFRKLENEWLDSLNIPHIQRQHKISLNDRKRAIKADGYDSKTNTVYEFYGDLWHGNPDCYKPDDFTYFGKRYGDLYQKTLLREQRIKQQGYNLVTIWESEWNDIKQPRRP